VNKDLFAMSVCTVDGQRFHLGDYDQWYTMQSTSKPFFYSIAHALLGDKLHDFVGHEPSGTSLIWPLGGEKNAILFRSSI